MGLAATTALAADDDGVWNAGVAASFADYEFDSNALSDNSAGFKLFAGYRVNKWLGLEGAYQNFGDFNEDLDPPNPGGSATADVDGFSGSVLVFAPLENENFEIYGKAGYYFFDQEAVVDDVVIASNSPDGILLGAGGRFFVSEQFSVRSEAEWFDIDDGSLWALNIGFEYRFGR
jgi:OOP family OmpA-OmpF porin